MSDEYRDLFQPGTTVTYGAKDYEVINDLAGLGVLVAVGRSNGYSSRNVQLLPSRGVKAAKETLTR